MPEPQTKVFASIRYIISSSVPPQRADELRHVLNTNGALYLQNGRRDPTLTTVITNSNRFEGWEEVTEKDGIQIVSDKWVERSVILGRIQPPQCFSPDPAMIFSGIVGCATGLPSADLEVLSAGITALGGQWRMGLTKEVTHLFAISPGSSKYATAMHFRDETGVKVILPHWFDDAVRLGMGNLPTKVYEWPDPELLKGIDGLALSKESGKVKGVEVERGDVKKNMYATAALFTPAQGRSSPPSEADISLVLNRTADPTHGTPGTKIKQAQVLQGRKILLSRTLELYKGRREAVQVGIERAGGVVIRFDGEGDEPEPLSEQERQGGREFSIKERVRRMNEAKLAEDCDILVTRWRYGRAYVCACQKGKTVGTLAWLFHVQSTGILSNPQDQLLHYPVPKRTIEAFSNHVITVTNYTGEAREYIKKLIAVMGATFTPSMSGQNTVLIAAYLGGTKAGKAQSWSIPIVNHTWLEDCFIQWRNLTVALEKYIIFPAGVDFSTLLGERGVGVGSRVVSEVEDLAMKAFEEDGATSYKQGINGVNASVVDVDMPQGTEGSAKEVARGLINVDEDIVGQEFQPRPTPRSKKSSKKRETMQPPAGMDLDFELPSTAAIVANDMDWSLNFDDDQRVNTPEPHGEEQPGKPKERLASSAEAETTRRRSRRTSDNKARNKDEGGSEEDDEAEVETGVRGKQKGLMPGSQDEEFTVVAKKVPKAKIEVLELDDSDSNLSKRMKPLKKMRDRKFASADEEFMEGEGDEAGVHPKVTSRSATLSNTKSAGKAPEPSLAKRGTKKSKAITWSPAASGDDLDPRTKSAMNPMAPSAQVSSKAKKLTSNNQPEPSPDAKLTPEIGPLRRRLTVEVVMISPSKRHGKAIQPVADDDGDIQAKPTKGKKTATTVVSKETDQHVGVGGRFEGLLKRTRGDAKTRIKRKSIRNEKGVDSEDELVIVGKSRPQADDSEQEEPVRSNKPKPKNQSTSSRKGRKVEDKPRKPRSKALRVYSSEEVESEDVTWSKSAGPGSSGDNDSDNDLPEVINLAPGSRGKANTTVRNATRTRSKFKVRGDGKDTGAKTTPKRTISVLMPSLAMSGGSRRKGRQQQDDSSEEADAMRRPPKSESKLQTHTTDSEEAEVDAIVSPQTRTRLAKSDSIKAAAGQLSLKDALNRSMISNAKTTHDPPESYKSRKRELEKSLPMDVDDDDSRFTPVSGHSLAAPRRNAAAKASQRLRETLMPDLMNFEAQMKRSKGKGRQSASSLTAFALDSETDQEHIAGKRKKVAPEEISESDDEQPKKKRRVSEENEVHVQVKTKAKRKQPAKDNTKESTNNLSSDIVLLTTQVTLSDDVVKSLTKLGVRMTTRPNDCTHLLAPHLVRTEKFLCALARAPFILSAKWATASAAAKKLLPEKDFILKDETGEKKYDVNLAQALRRAKTNKGKLLAGKVFYVTPRVAVDKKLLKNVVTACGGELTSQSPSVRIIKAAPEKRHVISCKEDISIWRPIAAQGFKIYSQELLLTAAMKQRMEWERDDLMVEL